MDDRHRPGPMIGLAAIQKLIDQLPAEYQEIVKEHKNPTMGAGMEYNVSGIWFLQWFRTGMEATKLKDCRTL